MFGYTGLRTSFKKVQNVGNMVMLQILPSILTPHSLTFLSNFPFEGSRGNDSFLIERRHTHVKDLKHVWHESQHGWNLSHMCYHTSSMWSYNPLVCISADSIFITDHLEFLTGLMFSMYIVWESRKYILRFSNISILFDMFL